MKKIIIVLIILILAITCVIFSGCGEDTKDNTQICKVTFLDWDGSIIQVSEIAVGGSPQMPITLKKEDEGTSVFEFVGWDDESTSDEEKLTTITDVRGDMTLKAIYKSSRAYYVHFMVDGEEYLSYKAGSIFNAPVPEKEGYEFDGWYKEDTFETKTEIHFSYYRYITKDEYLYAKFKEL